MKKQNFVTVIMAIVGILIFGFGMCMCLISEWDAFGLGIITAVVGVIVLIVLALVRRKIQGKALVVINGKTIGIVLLTIVGVIVFGLGMCMVTLWGLMVWGVIIGIVGLVLLLCLIPLCRSLQ